MEDVGGKAKGTREDIKLMKQYLDDMEKFIRWEKFPGADKVKYYLVTARRFFSVPKCCRDALEEINLWKRFIDKLVTELQLAHDAFGEALEPYEGTYEKLVQMGVLEDLLDSDSEFPVDLKEMILLDLEDRCLLKMEKKKPVEVSQVIKDQFKSLPSLKSNWEEKQDHYNLLSRLLSSAKKIFDKMEAHLHLSWTPDDDVQDEEDNERQQSTGKKRRRAEDEAAIIY